MSETTETIVERLARIETRLDGLTSLLAASTTLWTSQFTLLSSRIERLDDKLDALLLREAENRGEKSATRKMAGYISAITGVGVAGTAELLRRIITGI